MFIVFLFFFNDTATTEIYTLSLHDALPISLLYDEPGVRSYIFAQSGHAIAHFLRATHGLGADRKSTRLNSSHDQISYAVFCLKKKNQPNFATRRTFFHFLLGCCFLSLKVCC